VPFLVGLDLKRFCRRKCVCERSCEWRRLYCRPAYKTGRVAIASVGIGGEVAWLRTLSADVALNYKILGYANSPLAQRADRYLKGCFFADPDTTELDELGVSGIA
jgi:hypothetical protein